MKTIVIISICVLFLPGLAITQNYQVIYADKTACFKNHSGRVECISIDSVSIDSNVILYPFRVNQRLTQHYSPFVASWIGNKVVMADDGLTYFFNKNSDTILINTRASLHEEWSAFHWKDSLNIKAKIMEHGLVEFLGLSDSVKTIGFQAYDSEMNPVIAKINTLQLKISQNYGFLKTMNFHDFPLSLSQWHYSELEEFVLVGLSEPMLGVQNLTWFDVFDFQVGDELHVLKESGFWIGEAEGSFMVTETKNIYKYLERTDYTDSIVYSYLHEQNVHRTWMDSICYQIDTLEKVILPNPGFDKMPSQPVFGYFLDGSDASNVYYYYVMSQGEHLKKSSYNYWYETYSDNYWYEMHYDGVPREIFYMKGLGGPYYPYDAMFGSSLKQELVYYKKGDITWGTPLVLSNNTQQISMIEPGVFPNPARDLITVRTNNEASPMGWTIHIFDANGRIVKSGKLSSGDNLFNIGHLNPGFYFYRISSPNGLIKTDKLIIR